MSHRPQPTEYADSDRQFFATTIDDAIARAHELADGKDVGIQGGVALTSAIKAGLVEEFVLHQVPVLLGAGRPFFGALPRQVTLELVDVNRGTDVTHLHYRIRQA